MTHDELDWKLSHYNYMEAAYLISALRSVVELHKPIEGHEHLCSACWFGDGMMPYPCPTIQSIEKALL